jgi:Protein of unknown function (DUF3105)
VLSAAALFGVAAAALTGDDDADDEGPGAAGSVERPAEMIEPGPLVTEVRDRSPVGRFEIADCRRQAHSVSDPETWFHPRELFYPPRGDAPTRADLDHLARRDFALIVLYRRDAPRAARDALERWAAEGIGVIVAPNRAGDRPELEAYTFDRRLTCDGVDLDQLTEFTDRHFSRPLDYEPHGNQSGGR